MLACLARKAEGLCTPHASCLMHASAACAGHRVLWASSARLGLLYNTVEHVSQQSEGALSPAGAGAGELPGSQIRHLHAGTGSTMNILHSACAAYFAVGRPLQLPHCHICAFCAHACVACTLRACSPPTTAGAPAKARPGPPVRAPHATHHGGPSLSCSLVLRPHCTDARHRQPTPAVTLCSAAPPGGTHAPCVELNCGIERISSLAHRSAAEVAGLARLCCRRLVSHSPLVQCRRGHGGPKRAQLHRTRRCQGGRGFWQRAHEPAHFWRGTAGRPRWQHARRPRG